MHSLHNILVCIDDIVDFTNHSKDEQVQLVQEFVFPQLDDLDNDWINRVFDWHSYKDAGRWSNKYPSNVIIGSYDSETLISILKERQAYQDIRLLDSIQILEKAGCQSLKDIISIIKDMNIDHLYSDLSFAMITIGNYLAQRYTFDSGFLYINNNIGIVTTSLLNEVISKPERFALLLIDCHI